MWKEQRVLRIAVCEGCGPMTSGVARAASVQETALDKMTDTRFYPVIVSLDYSSFSRCSRNLSVPGCVLLLRFRCESYRGGVEGGCVATGTIGRARNSRTTFGSTVWEQAATEGFETRVLSRRICVSSYGSVW